jgi:hypothetical protein
MANNENKNGGRPEDKEIPIQIDHRPYKAPRSPMTVAELRVLAEPDISTDYDLFREVPGPGDDVKLGDTESVELRPGMHFYSVLRQINPGASDDVA